MDLTNDLKSLCIKQHINSTNRLNDYNASVKKSSDNEDGQGVRGWKVGTEGEN